MTACAAPVNMHYSHDPDLMHGVSGEVQWRKSVSQKWTDVERAAFQDARRLLQGHPVLAHFDPRLPIQLTCDVNPIGIECVLSQKTAGVRSVAFYSRPLNDTERRCSQTDREGLAVLAGVKTFSFLFGGQDTRGSNRSQITAGFDRPDETSASHGFAPCGPMSADDGVLRLSYDSYIRSSVVEEPGPEVQKM